MKGMSSTAKALMAVVMVADLAVFSGVSVLKLTGFGVGTILILLGLLYSYRQTAAAGLLIVLTTAAASVELATLLEIRTLLIGVLGLMFPLAVLTWISLGPTDEPIIDQPVARSALLSSAAYGALCVLSIPIVLLIISFVEPGLSLRTTTMTEGAIMLIAAVAGGVLVTLRGPRQSGDKAPPGTGN